MPSWLFLIIINITYIILIILELQNIHNLKKQTLLLELISKMDSDIILLKKRVKRIEERQ